jgi:hypothetical protein
MVTSRWGKFGEQYSRQSVLIIESNFSAAFAGVLQGACWNIA